ncbi:MULTISPECIES: MipA/OmpV family protein [unclassified Brenneria]|uniref:MipA/OmpV family protein n=1 Tax=unclassified Brenneria TaxID=2634434 RepID=UPI001553A9E0|nr:MipA/OmpV family protein [Brenneria sp. HEZEL_4_2_4]NPD00560.1 MipA/OmpV family protein [Brenneria sp. hezel4-2-4]
MSKTSTFTWPLPLFTAVLFLPSAGLWAADEKYRAVENTASGFTLLSDEPNVTQWGLGVGVGYEESPYEGVRSSFSPLPLLYFDDKWVHFFANKLDLKVGRWSDVSVTLRGEYALGDGYKGSDSSALSGMEKRKGAFWYGPTVAWNTGFGTLSGEFLTAGSKGQKSKIHFGKDFNYTRWSLTPYVSAEWLSHKNVDYYYGVRESETRAGRAAYDGESTYNFSLGSRFDYRLAEHQKLGIDISLTRLGRGVTDSPLVDHSVVPAASLYYLYQF